MKKLVLTCAIAALAGCGDETKKTTETGSGSSCNSALTFENDIKAIVQTGGSGNCQGCHANYGSLNGIAAEKEDIIERVQSTSASKVMPQNNLSFKSSAEGQKLISWLACDTLK